MELPTTPNRSAVGQRRDPDVRSAQWVTHYHRALAELSVHARAVADQLRALLAGPSPGAPAEPAR